MRISWIYKLRRDELIAELRKYDLNCEGIVKELRQRLVKWNKIASVSDLVRKVEIVQEKLAKIAKEKPTNNFENRFSQNRNRNNVMSVTAP